MPAWACPWRVHELAEVFVRGDEDGLEVARVPENFFIRNTGVGLGDVGDIKAC
jgi:hypothetical protein